MTRVSVVIPALDAAEHLGATLDAVRAQTHPDVEILVVDNGSTDGTGALVARRGVRCERLEERGLSHARNVGLTRTAGAHVLFLDADDLIGPDTLAALSRALDAAPAPSVAACPWQRLVFAGGAWRPRPRVPDPPPDQELPLWIEGVWFVPPCALLWPRPLLEALGPWDESLTANIDGDMALRALVAGARVVRADAGHALYRRHAGTAHRSVSMGRTETDLRSRVRVLEKVAAALAASGQLERHRVALARGYHRLARAHFAALPAAARECARRAEALAGPAAIAGSWPHRVACRLFGLERKERLAGWLRR